MIEILHTFHSEYNLIPFVYQASGGPLTFRQDNKDMYPFVKLHKVHCI